MGGAEILGHNELGYKDCPVINIKPDVNDIVEKIEKILEKKNQFGELGKRSREFIEKHHNHIKIAQKYVDIWTCNE